MDGDADDSESVMTDLLSPGGQTDAQTLACMLQVLSLVWNLLKQGQLYHIALGIAVI